MSATKPLTKSAKVKSVIWDYFILTVGTMLYAFSWSCMFVPNQIASGGVTGAATVINFATGIPVYISFGAINILLLVMGFLILGNAFGFKTIYVIAISTFFLDIFAGMENWYIFFDNKLLLVVVASCIESYGISLVLDHGGSTGGTDIVALIINKFWPVSLGTVYLCCDVFIIASVLLVPGKTLEDMVYGYVAMIIFSVFVDWVTLGRKSTWQLLVFSEKYEQIADYIIKELDRGVTALNAVGWFTKNEKKVLLILVRKNQLHNLTKVIKNIDPKAFISVSSASTVYGEGFDEIKTGVSIKNLKKKKNNADEQKQNC